MTDHVQEQEMEIEALEAILMDDFKEIDPSESGVSTTSRCFQITLSPQRLYNSYLLDHLGLPTSSLEWLKMAPRHYFIVTGTDYALDDDLDPSNYTPVQLALIFSHTETYPDEPPLLNVKSIRGIKTDDLNLLREKLRQEAHESLGMAMIYTLATSAKEWLHEKYGQNVLDEVVEEPPPTKDDIIIPHGEPVTTETFLAWRERFEAELALERAKLMPESALTVPKDRRLTGRQWFESGRAATKGAATVTEDSEEEEEIDFDDDFEDDDDDDEMLEHYLAQKSEKSS